MLTIERSIAIAGAPERIYAYMDDPKHLPEFWPSVLEVKDVERLPNGGRRFRYVYKMIGRRFEGESETIERIANRRIVDRLHGELDATLHWDLHPHNGVTQVELRVEYEPPKTVLQKLEEPIVRRLNEHEAQALLENLKLLLEA